MRTQKVKTEYIHIRISTELKNSYTNYCNINGYSLSKRLRMFIENEIKDGKK